MKKKAIDSLIQEINIFSTDKTKIDARQYQKNFPFGVKENIYVT